MVEIRELNTKDYEELASFNANFPGMEELKRTG